MLEFLRRRPAKRTGRRRPTQRRLKLESLETRSVLSTFSVLNLDDNGAGSLRQAILDANAAPGADEIDFEVVGTILLTSDALPSITDEVNIDGASAPGFAGQPLVGVDFNNFDGMLFKSGSDGSELTSLALTNAAGNGVTVKSAGHMEFFGNYVGIDLNAAVAPNRGDGIALDHSSDNAIGSDTVVSGYLVIDRNVISGNQGNGISLKSSYRNTIEGNYIGVGAFGTADQGNTDNGIWLHAGADNLIGGSVVNIISGNDANGVLLTGGSHHNTLAGNYIGTIWNGAATLGNSGDGVKFDGANFNLIGNDDPVAGVTYYEADVTGWQGLRGADNPGEYLISGTIDEYGLIYEGPIDGSGTYTTLSFQPDTNVYNTSVYGPDNLDDGVIRLVGSYKNNDYATAAVEVNGFVFEGTTAELGDSSKYTTIAYPGAKYNYVHSTAGGLAVGNHDSPVDWGKHDLPFGPGHAYIYDVASKTFIAEVKYPGAKSNSAYGIWHNGGTSYTIVGGYSLDYVNNFDNDALPLGTGYIVDYDSATGEFSHWTSLTYPDGVNIFTHFEGISSVADGVYTLAATSAQADTGDPTAASWVVVRREDDGSFGSGRWLDLDPNPSLGVSGIPTANSVYGNQVVGVVIGDTLVSYQATINEAFQLSNVISGNGANGIEMYASDDNRVSMNYIGTDATGTVDLGNAASGVLITHASKRNLIGGEVTGGNDPTADDPVFVQPPLGNVISGNDGDGVLISNKSTKNQLSGNFIGTDQSGNAALGNSGNGVSIIGANKNSILGTTFQQSPFVFYNVISGNTGNGLQVYNSDNTTVHANFFGIGADNNTAVPNQQNGIVVEGNSAHTTVGGPIPLGNVVAANLQNGIVVRDKASYFISYNTFAGVAAFTANTTLGNGLDGMLITSTGGNNLLRTNVVSSNGDDGIEVSGAAKDVRIAGDIVGLNWDGSAAMGNADNGIEIGGNAHDILVGGPQPTFNVIPLNAIGGNLGNGVAILDTAHDVTVSHSVIGTEINGLTAVANAENGVYIGPGTYENTIGSRDSEFHTVISGNDGNGIAMDGTRDNKVIGAYIGTDYTGLSALGNGENGVYIVNGFDNSIGRGPNSKKSRQEDIIAFNGANGVYIASGTGNSVLDNSIHSNTSLGIDLAAGANLNQAAPVLATVAIVDGKLVVTGSLTSTPKKTFKIQFFANESSEPSGTIFIGSMKVKTKKSGTVSFTFKSAIPPAGADYITATATSSKDNTSEFSAAIS